MPLYPSPAVSEALINDDCLHAGYQGRLFQLFCAVLYTTVVHDDQHIHQQFLRLNAGLHSGLVFVCLVRFSILRVFLF